MTHETKNCGEYVGGLSYYNSSSIYVDGVNAIDVHEVYYPALGQHDRVEIRIIRSYDYKDGWFDIDVQHDKRI